MTGLDEGGIRAVGGERWGGGSVRGDRVPFEEYAAALAARELILDETGIRAAGGSVTGDVERAWAMLAEHAARFGVVMTPGDFQRTNRVLEWDDLIMSDARVQEGWSRAYPTALARVAGLPVDQEAGASAVRHLQKQPSLLWNAFVPLALRRPAITGELRAFALKTPTLAPRTPAPARGEDVSVFPGERLSNLSDFARLQHRLQSGDFMGTLYKEGLDPVEFARISDRWAKRLAGDQALRAEYAIVLKRTGDVAAVKHTEPLPPQDTIVFPGHKLARVSDFARISRAAKRGDFKAALERAGVDADTFANLCARFNARMQVDAVVAAQFKRLLLDARIDG